MASLSNTKIKDTYESLVKFSDNGNITVGAKQLTDGFGNNSPFFVSTTQIGIGVTPTIGFDLHVNSNSKIGGNLVVGGNLTVNGTLTYLNVEDLATEDPLIKLARNNDGNSLDIGYFGQYVESAVTKYKGLYNDADDNKFKLFIGTSDEPTTVVNTGGTGYAVGTLVANLEGNVTGGTISGTTGTFSGNLSANNLSGTNTGDQTLPTDFVSKANGGTFGGQITIPETPTADGHAASKKYVDDEIADVDVAKRIEITVKNVSGSSLVKGAVVHASPTATPPSGNVVEVIGADNDVTASMPAIGVLNEALADDAEGQCVMFGSVTGINTSSFSAGDELYVGSTAATFTNTKPTSTGNLIQKIAIVIKVHATNGSIEVFGAGRTNDVPNEVDRDLSIAGDLTIGTNDFIAGTATIGTVTGNLTGNVTGNLTGNVTGNLTGNVTGSLTGNSAGTHTGAVVGNVTGNITGNAYLNTTAYQGGEGTELDNSAFNVDGIGTNFRWIESNSGSTGSTWKKVADIVITDTITPNGVQLEAKVYQPNTNSGVTAGLHTIYYSVAFRGRIDDSSTHNDAIVYGKDANLLRVYKTADYTFELQARSNDDNRDLVVECNITSKKGSKVTPTTTYVDGTITGGTAYTATANNSNKTKFAGDVEFEGAVFDDAEVEDLRVNEFLYFGSGATSGYGPHIQHSDSGGTGKGMRITVDSDLQVWGVTGNAGEQNQGLYVAGGVAKLYDLNGVVLETVLGGVDITGTLEVSGTITGDVTGDVTGDLTGSVTGAASLNVLKAGDTMTGDLILNDDVKASFGNDSDLFIVHNDTNGVIENIKGDLVIQNKADDSDVLFRSDDGSGGIVEYFRLDGSTNTVPFGRSPHLPDGLRLYFGNDTTNDASIRWDSTASQLFISGESKFLSDVTITSSGLGNTPTLAIDNTASNSFIHSIEAFGANLTSGQTNIIVVGKAGSSKNSGYIGYNWDADGSDTNYISLGHWAADHLVKIYASGGVTFVETITSTKDGIALQMDGGASAEGVRMQANGSGTYPVFLRSINPASGETSPWIYQENTPAWGIWHNNPINSFDFTRSTIATGIEQNVGGETNTVMIRLNNTNGSGTFVGNISGAAISGTTGTFSSIANATTDTDKFLVSDSGVIKYRTGAEVASDILGDIDDTFVRYDSTLQTTSHNVMVKLKNTDTDAGGYGEIHVLNDNDDKIVVGSIGSGYTNSSWANATYVYNTGTGRKMYIKSQNELRFFTGGTSISTNTALVLDTSRNATFSGTVQTTQITATNGLNHLKRDTDASLQLRSENTRSGLFITKPATDTVMGSALVLADESYRLGTANYYHMVMLQNGNSYFNQNLGVGTTTPERKLHIHNSATLTATYQKFTNGTATTGTTLGIDADGDFLINNGEAKEIKLYTNDTQRLTIQSGGNVGVNDTSPDYKLTVGKTSIAAPAFMVSGAYYGGPRIQTYGLDADPNAWMGLGTDMTGASYEHNIYFSDRNGSGRLSMGTYNGTTYSEKMCVLRTGNVGIGKSVPDSPLVVYRTGDVWHTIIGNDSGQLRIGGQTGSGAVVQSRTQSGTARDLYLQRDGKGVGIGTNLVYQKLQINGDSNNWDTSPSIRLWDTRNSKGWLVGNVNNATAGDFYIRTLPSVSGNPDIGVQKEFVIKHATGYIGIGTLSPQTKLDVTGSIQLSNQGRFKGWFTGGSGLGVEVGISAGDGYLLTYNRSNNSYGNTIIEGTGIQFVTHSSGKFYFTGGNVGIKTTNPLYNLQIGDNGVAGSYNMMIEGVFASTALASNPRLNLIDTNFGITAGKYGSGASDDALGIFGYQGAGRGILFAHTTAGSSTTLQNMRHDMFIDGGTGNVGIGQTSTPYKLTVADTTNDWMARFENVNSENVGVFLAHASGYGMAIDSSENDSKYLLKLAGGTGGGTGRGSQIRMLVQSDGNVGISTSDPKTILHIGPLSGGNGTAQERLRLSGDYNGTGSGALLRFTNQHNSGTNPNSGEYNLGGIIAYDFRSDWGGALALQTAPNTSSGGTLVSRLIIEPEGNITISERVSIGSTTRYTGTQLNVDGNRMGVRTSNSSWGQLYVANSNDAEVGITFGAGGTGRPGGTSTYTRQWIMGLSPFGTGTNKFSITNKTLQGNPALTIIENTGAIGLRKVSPSYQLDVTGDIRASGDVIAFSDKRVKENIITIDNALNKVIQLRGVTYTRKDKDDKSTKVGVIAQEVLEVLPEVVSKDDEGMYSVAYGNLAGLFIEAIKELKAEVDSLKQEIKELKK